MKLKNSFLAALFFSGLLSAQTITIDTTVTDNPAPENSIVEYWYWASGIHVTGSGFASNSVVTLTATAPDQTKRKLTATSDDNGNLDTYFNAMKINSVIGTYSLSAVDGVGAAATDDFIVIKDPLEVITATATPQEFKMDEFETGSLIKVSGFSPNALIKINVGDPAENYWEYNFGTEMYADASGNFEFNFDQNIPLFTGNLPIPLQPVEGNWTLSFHDFSGTHYIGNKKVRVLPSNPSTSSYGNIATFTTEPITSVVFSNITNNTDPNSSTSYEDYTVQIGNVERTKPYKITVKGNTMQDYKTSTFTAFIDWNQNGILDEDNEIYSIGYVIGSNGMDDKFAELDITVPADAVVGNTRMRILKVDSPSSYAMFWPTGASGFYYGGQIEDYTLNVKELLATNENSLTKVRMYPNPVKDVLTLATNKKVSSITAYNAAGQLVKTSENANTIDLSNFTPGVYLIKTEIEGKTETSKVIKK